MGGQERPSKIKRDGGGLTAQHSSCIALAPIAAALCHKFTNTKKANSCTCQNRKSWEVLEAHNACSCSNSPEVYTNKENLQL